MIKKLEDISNNIKLNQFLKKDAKRGQINKLTYSDEDIDFNKLFKNKKFVAVVEEFYDILKENFPKDYQYTFRRNIQTLKVKDNIITTPIRKLILHPGKHNLGIYRPLTNEMILSHKKQNRDNYKEIVMHELLHLSSNRSKNFNGLTANVPYKTGYIRPGESVDEGYTELLNQKYFSKNNDAKYYEDLKIFAYGIEKIVGKKKMEECYFKGLYMEFFDALANYTDKESDAMLLLLQINLYRKINNPIEEMEKFSKIKKDIADIYLIKLNRELKENKIDLEEYTKRKFYDIDMYLKHNFRYTDKAIVIEEKDYYSIAGHYGIINKNKSNFTLPFEPDIKYNKDGYIKTKVK